MVRDRKEKLQRGARRLGEVMNLLILTVVIVSQGYTCQNSSNQIFQYVQYTVYSLYLNKTV